MKNRIGLIGATGRLGKAIDALAPERIAARFHQANPPRPLESIDLFIDVSAASALQQNLRIALEAKKPIVIGTTGSIDFALLEEAAKYIAVFYSPNFSIGMALMRKAAALLAHKFSKTAEIRIVETHHEKKKDAPSGSALMLAKSIAPSQAAIQSIRLGQTIGKHELFLNGSDERLLLVHEALTLDAFARGALDAADFIAHQSPGLYTMDNLL